VSRYRLSKQNCEDSITNCKTLTTIFINVSIKQRKNYITISNTHEWIHTLVANLRHMINNTTLLYLTPLFSRDYWTSLCLLLAYLRKQTVTDTAWPRQRRHEYTYVSHRQPFCRLLCTCKAPNNTRGRIKCYDALKRPVAVHVQLMDHRSVHMWPGSSPQTAVDSGKRCRLTAVTCTGLHCTVLSAQGLRRQLMYHHHYVTRLWRYQLFTTVPFPLMDVSLVTSIAPAALTLLTDLTLWQRTTSQL